MAHHKRKSLGLEDTKIEQKIKQYIGQSYHKPNTRLKSKYNWVYRIRTDVTELENAMIAALSAEKTKSHF